MVVTAHLFDMVPGDVVMIVPLNLVHPVAGDDEVAVLADPFFDVVLNSDVLVFLSEYKDLFGASLIFQADFVEASAAFRAHRLDGALSLLVRQRIGNRLVGVIDSARDNRPVRIAFQKIDDHLLSDARSEDGAPALSRPN